MHEGISIHSTARVETRAYYAGLEAGHNFNPLHREGGDHLAYVREYRGWNFNPLHREGGDMTRPGIWVPQAHFNPLHREGGDKTFPGL